MSDILIQEENIHSNRSQTLRGVVNEFSKRIFYFIDFTTIFQN